MAEGASLFRLTLVRMRSPEERNWLIDHLASQLLPAFVTRGFETIPLSGMEAESIEFRRSFPFGRLRRRNRQGFDLVEVQLDKNKKAAFVLNAGVVPSTGVKISDGRDFDPSEVWVWWLPEHYRLYQRSLGLFKYDWFHIKHWIGRTVKERDYQALVEGVVKLIPEVELALSEGKCGPHVRKTVMSKQIGPSES